MSQPRRTIENLLQQGALSLKHADAAATHLEVYPNKRTWLSFFDKAALIIGVIALALALVFFVAYNWQNMGKIGKFALVEGALVITIALYVALSFRRRFTLIRQLLLLIASVITGSLLALFGQFYQTGADTWQLFFGWSAFIIPWVVIARFPTLWLLWLGLVNASLILYLDVIDFGFGNYLYQYIFQVTLLALLNFIALNLWLLFIDNTHIFSKTISNTGVPTKVDLHWSTYVVGLLSTYFITHLAIITVFDSFDMLSLLITLVLWAGWCGFMIWRFYRSSINLLMLTYVSGSIIAVVMAWASKLLLLDNWEAGSFLLLALLLIGMSSAAVVWLRKVADANRKHYAANATDKDAEHESNIANTDSHRTLDELKNLGLIKDNALNKDASSDESSPWFISVFFGFTGILASLFFIGFLTLLLFETRVFDSSTGLFIIGLLLSAAGFVLFKGKRTRNNAFMSSLAFAISVAGQAYVAFALFNSALYQPTKVWLFLFIQLIMTVIMPNFIYRLLSSGVALGCMVYLLGYYQASEASLAVLALITIIANLQRYPLLQGVPDKWRLSAFELSKAVGYASSFMLLIFSIYIVAGEYGDSFIYGYETFKYHYILAQVLLVLASLYAVYLIMQRYNSKLLSPSSLMTACTIVVLGVISVYVSGLLAASLVIIIAIANSQRILLALGILALVSYIFWYYYQLDTSLLTKSASLLMIGITVLLLRWLLLGRFAKTLLPFAPLANSKEGLL